ncbi:MAG: tyrosine-type recombinase/integrase [Actinomycetota bacterium]
MPKPERLTSGRFRIRYRDPWGRRVSRTFDTAADARAHYRRTMGDIARGEYADPRRARMTVAEWADEWLAGARRLSTGARETYRRDLDRYILPQLGNLPVGRLDPATIDRYLAGVDLAPSSVHRHYRTLHRMLRVAVDRGVIARNPCGPVEAPRIPPVDRRVLDVDEVDRLADAISPRYRAWLLVAVYGGLRWSESIGLRRRRVAGARLEVVEQLVRRSSGEWERVEPKARSIRTITLPAFVADELGGHLDRYSAAGPDGLVFCTRNGTPPTSSSFRSNVLGRALDRAGLPAIRIHDLRHSAVSLAIAAGADPKASQARAGHSSIGIHLDLYGHLYPAADAAVASALDDLHARAQRARLRLVGD